jgi:hypothetical protein
MKAKPKMWIRISCMLWLFIVLSTACGKKEKFEQFPPGDAVVEDALFKKFFNSNEPTDQLLQSVRSFVMRQNENYHFVNKFSTAVGFPIWNKSLVYANTGDATFSAIARGSTMIFIPFVKDKSLKVYSALAVRIKNGDTSCRMLYSWQYKQFDNAARGGNGKNAFQVFSRLNNLVFGTTEFKITDHSLVDVSIIKKLQEKNIDPDAVDIFYKLTDNPTGSQLNTFVTICNTYSYCARFKLKAFKTLVVAAECEQWGFHTQCVTYLFMADDDNDPGTGGGGGGGTGGGGGGGNPWNPTPDPCPDPGVPTTEFCDENGWEPLIVEPEDPCDAADQLAGAQATLQFLGPVATKVSEFTAFDPNVTNQAEEYFLVNEVNGSYSTGPILTSSSTGGSIQGVTGATHMAVHTHPYGGFPFPSASDFFDLATYTPSFMQNYIIAYDGTKYAMVIGSFSQLQEFVANHPNSIAANAGFEPNSSIGMQASVMEARLQAQGYSADEAKERTMAYIMKQAGVTLVKAAPGSDSFKKIGIRQKLVNGQLAVDPSGNPLFENADCN